MKKFHLLLIILFTAMLIFACQSADKGIPDLDTANYESPYFQSEDERITYREIINFDYVDQKGLSHYPTGIEHVIISNQSIIIDFTPDEYLAEAISYRNTNYENGHYIVYDDGQIIEGDLFDIFSTFGQLIDYYARSRYGYRPGYVSLITPIYDGEFTYPPVEYTLAQECFRDNCPTELRKVILLA